MAKVRECKMYPRVDAFDGFSVVVLKNPSDFVGAYIGHSEKNTRQILESTKGKVLVIDEVWFGELDIHGCSRLTSSGLYDVFGFQVGRRQLGLFQDRCHRYYRS
jgi:hypothetical protein